MRDLAFLPFFMACLPLALRFPFIGAMLWAWLSFGSPDEYMYGFMTSIPLSKIIAVLTVLSLLVQRDGRRLYIDGILFLMLCFVAVGLASASFSISPLPLNWDIFSKVAKIVVLCFVVTSVITTRRRLQGLLMAIVIGLAFNGVEEGGKVIASGGGHKVIGVATMGDNNSFAVAMLMCLPLLLYLFQTSAHKLARIGFMTAAVFCTIAVVGSYSRGGFLGLVTLAFGLIALNRNKLRNMVIVAVCGFVLFQAAPATWFERIHTIGTANQDDSFMQRVTAWKVSTLVAMDRPLIGGGFHAIQDTKVWQAYGRDLAKLDFVTSAPQREFGMAAHSIYFEVLGDLGFSGLAIFLGLLGLGLLACSTIRARATAYADMAWMGDLASMIRLSLIVYAVSGAALSFAYFELFYLLLAILSVTRRLQLEELTYRADEGYFEGRENTPQMAAPPAFDEPWLQPNGPQLT